MSMLLALLILFARKINFNVLRLYGFHSSDVDGDSVFQMQFIIGASHRKGGIAFIWGRILHRKQSKFSA